MGCIAGGTIAKNLKRRLALAGLQLLPEAQSGAGLFRFNQRGNCLLEFFPGDYAVGNKGSLLGSAPQGVGPQQQFEIRPWFFGGLDAQEASQFLGKIRLGDKLASSFGSFRVRTFNDQDIPGLIQVWKKSDHCIGVIGGSIFATS